MPARAEDQSQSGNVLLYVMVGIYVFLLVMVAKIAHSRKKRVAADQGEVKAHFGGSFGAFTLFLTTFSTVYSGYTVTGIPNEAFSDGFKSVRWIGATLVIVAGMLLLYPRLRRLAVERNYESPMDFITDSLGTVQHRVNRIGRPLWHKAAAPLVRLLRDHPNGHLHHRADDFVLRDGGRNDSAAHPQVMIASFLVVGVVLAAEYGSIPEIGPADCPYLESVSANVTNRFSAPLQPHMVQRAYIASSDANLRIVMAAMLVAPFVAQPPGILIGLTKSAYNPSWPLVDQEANAFSGPFQYFLVTLMTCSCLAAIMSTADSALMGASSIVSLDIFKKTLSPSMSKKNLVRIGEVNSVLVCGLAFLLAMFLSKDQMGRILVFQNGMLMQLLPAFGFGLYFQVTELSVSAGILAGLISFVILTIIGNVSDINVLDGYVPDVNVSVFVNFLVVILTCLVAPRSKTASQLDVAKIRSLMSTSREPKLLLVALMVGIALISAPWFGQPGSAEPMIWGAPRWAIIQLLSYVAIFCLGLLASFLWKPPAPGSPSASNLEPKVIGGPGPPPPRSPAASCEGPPRLALPRHV
eukprot:Skav234241  [mRNA]  locus=scaffold1464:491085:498634:- [translate_table: standard]